MMKRPVAVNYSDIECEQNLAAIIRYFDAGKEVPVQDLGRPLGHDQTRRCRHQNIAWRPVLAVKIITTDDCGNGPTLRRLFDSETMTEMHALSADRSYAARGMTHLRRFVYTLTWVG